MTTLESHRLIEARQIADQRARAWHVPTGAQTLLHGLAYAPGLAGLALERLHVDRLQLQQQPLELAPAIALLPTGLQAATQQARLAIESAPRLATQQRSHYVGTEHLLAALVLLEGEEIPIPSRNTASALLEPFGVDFLAIERELASLAHCSLAWRLEFSPERGGEVFWRKLDRDVFTWREATCVKLAASIRDEQAFDRLPILGDALEEAGCTDLGVLRHCREHTARHTGWCWLLETLLGEQTTAP